MDVVSAPVGRAWRCARQLQQRRVTVPADPGARLRCDVSVSGRVVTLDGWLPNGLLPPKPFALEEFAGPDAGALLRPRRPRTIRATRR